MSTNITYRVKSDQGITPKGEPLTNLEIDNNFYVIDELAHSKLNFPGGAGLVVSAAGGEASLNRELTVSGLGLSIANGDGVNGNPSLTLASDTNNTGNTLVYRDGNGNFSAGQITATLISGKLYLDTGEVVEFEGPGGDGFVTKLDVVAPTANNTIRLPDVSGTIVTTGDTGTVDNTMLAGSIANNKLVNDSITIDGNAVSLGSSISLENTNFDWNGNHRFIDSNFTIVDENNISKQFGFQVSGLPSGTTVNLVVPNENLQTIATRNYVDTNTVASSGDTMTGFLTLHSNPTSNLHAATKQYVDDAIASDADIIWVSLTGNPANTLLNYNSRAVGTLVAMNYRFSETYWVGNGNATRTVNEKRIYIKTGSTTWQQITSLR